MVPPLTLPIYTFKLRLFWWLLTWQTVSWLFQNHQLCVDLEICLLHEAYPGQHWLTVMQHMYFEFFLISECLRLSPLGNKLWNGALHPGSLWGPILRYSTWEGIREARLDRGKFWTVMQFQQRLQPNPEAPWNWDEPSVWCTPPMPEPASISLYGPVIGCRLPQEGAWPWSGGFILQTVIPGATLLSPSQATLPQLGKWGLQLCGRV